MCAPVSLLPNQGWDARILVCGYDLHYAGCMLPMHVFIVVTQRAIVFVDTLVNEATARALIEVARPHLRGRELLVVNTHADFDHAWGNQYFDAHGSMPAPIIGTELCAERMRSSDERERLARMQREQPDVYAGVRLCPPDIRFGESLTFDGVDLTLQLFATPGHTPDHCSLYIPEIRTLLAGDAAEAPFPSPDEGGLAELRRSLRRMDALDAQAALYCHAPVSAGPSLVRSNLAYFDTLEDRCRSALTGGAPASLPPDADVEALVEFPYAEAVPMAMEGWAQAGYYRPAHGENIRAMLAHCAGHDLAEG